MATVSEFNEFVAKGAKSQFTVSKRFEFDDYHLNVYVRVSRRYFGVPKKIQKALDIGSVEVDDGFRDRPAGSRPPG